MNQGPWVPSISGLKRQFLTDLYQHFFRQPLNRAEYWVGPWVVVLVSVDNICKQ